MGRLSDPTRELCDLVQRCLSGDQAAMRAFVDRYRDTVFRLCFRMLGQRQDAEDAAQETFVRALRSMAQWDAERRMEPWLLTIAGNRCRTMLATRKRRPVAGVLEDEVVDDTPSRSACQQLAEELELALQQIRPEYREAFLLYHEHQLNYEEIALSMERPLGTIKTWIRRARHELASQLRRRQVLMSA